MNLSDEVLSEGTGCQAMAAARRLCGRSENFIDARWIEISTTGGAAQWFAPAPKLSVKSALPLMGLTGSALVGTEWANRTSS
jgi:hypothetical protein